ncbi:hypothetical protein M8J75_007789 [Diaphorina citri]|nr:hypothetical protein M8J75_007789 [Diaphorina citri]
MHSMLTPQILSSLSQRKIFTVQNFLCEPVEKLIAITTLSFKGGFYSGTIYEVCSPAGEGKTQFCHTVAARMRNPVYYLDSKGDYSALRIIQINSVDASATLDRILVCYVDSLIHLIQVLYDLVSKFESSSCQETKLVIVDSVPTHFYSLLDSSYNCQGYLSQIGNLLKYLAHKLGCIVLTTNLLSISSEPHEEDRPGMGKYWNHVPNVRIKMVESNDHHVLSIMQTNSRKLKVNQSVNVRISLSGVD